jgi:hypothetical protein
VKENGDWTLMCPHECPGLSDTHSAAFEALYTKYEKEGKGRKTIKAQDLWFKILESQIETGTPYMLYKDAANAKSNQQNLGTIKSSNLCTEIIEYTAPLGMFETIRHTYRRMIILFGLQLEIHVTEIHRSLHSFDPLPLGLIWLLIHRIEDALLLFR